MNPKSGSNAIKLKHLVFGSYNPIIGWFKSDPIIGWFKNNPNVGSLFMNPSFGSLVQITGLTIHYMDCWDKNPM